MVLVDWDAGNWPKCGKHGVSQMEIAQVLSGDPMIFDDPTHSGAEVRYRAIGRTAEGRSVFIAFTVRHMPDGLHFRPVSARYMHKKEVDHYVQAKT